MLLYTPIVTANLLNLLDCCALNLCQISNSIRGCVFS